MHRKNYKCRNVVINVKNKFLNKKIIIIAGITLFGIFLIGVNGASATILGDVAQDILLGIFYVLLTIAQAFTGFVGNIFTAILNFGFQDLGVIQQAWGIVRDIVNMFFILGLVVIAFATILRIQEYGVKKLLPKIILIALLINFSYLLPAIIVDFSQILTNYFLNQIDTSTGEIKEIGGAVMQSLKINDSLTSSPELSQTVGFSEQNPAISVILTMAFSIAVVFATGFVMIIGSILLIIRMGAIWILLILAPIAWFFSIFPGKLKTNASKWWDEFLKWTFFAPIYTFFIYLVLKIAVAWGEAPPSLGSSGAIESLSIVPMYQDLGLLFKFVFLVILLFGAPVIAMSMGIKSAGTVTSTVKGGFKKVGKWTGRQTMRPIKSAGRAVGAGALTVGGRLFGKKIGGRMEAKGFQLRQKAAAEKQHKAFQELLGTMSNENVEKEMHTKGIRGFLATQEAKKRGILRESGRKDVARAMETMRANGATEEARSLEELRPDAIEKGTQREEAIERAISNGTHKKWSKKVLEGDEGIKAVGKLRKQLGSAEFAKVFKGWASEIQEVGLKALKDGFTDNFDDKSTNKETKDDAKDNIGRRQAYASLTGDLDTAFKGYEKNTAIEASLQEYIEGWDNEGFKVLNKPAAGKSGVGGKNSREIVVEYMKPSQVDGAGLSLSGTPKEEMKEYAKKQGKVIHEQMQRSLGWGTNKTVDLSDQKKDKKTIWGPDERPLKDQ